MLYLGSEIALAVGVKIETRIEPALAVAVDTVRAALTVSTATASAALSVGVKIKAWIEPALAVVVDMVRATLTVSTGTARAGSIHGRKNLNHINIIVKTDFPSFFPLRHG